MKIICISNNLSNQNTKNKKPVFFLKPDTSILNNRKLFFIPHFTENICCGVSPVIKINRVGKNISEKFAHRYFDEIGIGLDMTDISMYEKSIEEHMPWEASKAFEDSAPIGLFVNKNQMKNPEKIDFSLSVNNNIIKKLKIENLHHSVSEIISYISQFFTLKIGDLIFISTNENLSPVKKNDNIQAFIGDVLALDILIK